MRKSGSFGNFIVPVFLSVSSLTAGVVFQVETTYHSGSGASSQSQITVQMPNIKMEILPSRGTSGGTQDEAVFRGDRREMVIINHSERSYMVMGEKEIQRLGGQVRQAQSQLEKQLSQLDPSQRALLEQALKGRLGAGAPGAAPQPAPEEYRRTSQRETRQGYPCVKYEVLRDGEKVRELWVTDWSNVKGSSEVVGAFREMAEFFEELRQSFGQMAGASGGFFNSDSNAFGAFTQVDGFPVVTRNFSDGELESETVLESVTERDLDPDAFEPPRGYRLRSMGPQ